MPVTTAVSVPIRLSERLSSPDPTATVAQGEATSQSLEHTNSPSAPWSGRIVILSQMCRHVLYYRAIQPGLIEIVRVFH